MYTVLNYIQTNGKWKRGAFDKWNRNDEAEPSCGISTISDMIWGRVQ